MFFMQICVATPDQSRYLSCFEINIVPKRKEKKGSQRNLLKLNQQGRDLAMLIVNITITWEIIV